MYEVKKEYKDSIVYAKEKIVLSEASQKQLKSLYEIGHDAVIKTEKKKSETNS